MTVHPRNRFSMKMAGKFRLARPTMDGRKYSAAQSPKAIRWNTVWPLFDSTKIAVLRFPPGFREYPFVVSQKLARPTLDKVSN